jgi:hypothetical protein
MTELNPYLQVANKESRRRGPSLYQTILLKKANSKLIYEMVRNDPTHFKARYIAKKAFRHSKARLVAEYMKHANPRDHSRGRT